MKFKKKEYAIFIMLVYLLLRASIIFFISPHDSSFEDKMRDAVLSVTLIDHDDKIYS